MPVIYELNVSRELSVGTDGASLTRKYFVNGTNNENEVVELVYATAPVLFDGLVRQTIGASPQGGPCWLVDVEYGPGNPAEAVGVEPEEPVAPGLTEELSASFSFDTSGATVHITQSLDTWSQSAGAPDTKKAIGVTKDRVEGCDILVPKMDWQLDVTRRSCTGQYLMNLSRLTGRANRAPFYGAALAEVLYLGASGKYTNKDRWSITHRFSFSPNRVDIDVGNGIILPEKYGHQYMWVGYGPAVDGGQLIQVPIAAYAEKVYESGDFSLLQVGG